VPDWPSKLNGLIKTRGSLYGGSWQMSVPELKITGNVKQNKVDVERLAAGQQLSAVENPGLHLALGPNSADIKGELGVKDLTWTPPSMRRIWITPCRAGRHGERAGESARHRRCAAAAGGYHRPRLRWQELTIAQVNVKGM
jgi:translocation and assembly module TamB